MTSLPRGSSTSNLTILNINYGARETPWDLKYLLYHGGSKASTWHVNQMIDSGLLGQPIRSRIDLVNCIYEAITSRLAGGGSRYSARNEIRFIREMFKWAEENQHPIHTDSIEQIYLRWTDSLIHRCQVVKDLSQRSAYTKGMGAGIILDLVLNREIPLISTSRLYMPSQRKTAQGISAEKQNLSDTFAFGHFLQDISDALPVEVILKAPLPVRIPLRLGGELTEWSAYNPSALTKHLAAYDEGFPLQNYERCISNFKAWEADGTLRTRYPLANRRIEAELLIFIGQTGMNLAQAHKLKLRNFTYSSYIDGYQVRDRKARRGGEVLFEIFKEYKPHFERYLEWRRQLFPLSDALFPFIRLGGRAFEQHPQFGLRSVCKDIGLRFIPPQTLRNTRVNWLLRKSGDADLTASMAQHQKETLLGVYERPSQQRAINEIIRFWSKHDPTLTRTTPAGPGQCDGKPAPLEIIPNGATAPDCIRPSGCMWCQHHRDVDSQDYLWCLASFRHLKIIEVSKWAPPQNSKEPHPAQHVIDRVSEKLRWFNESNARRKKWTEEIFARIEEENYHPDWAERIHEMEGI
ncbi:site-specific integrase [Pseudomonas sp. 905_Psudmo1]|nr:site-specific integrase [Pseudomonas sp. 905_Psudmo1]WFS19907.1 site-specific integrase [Pseudomonas sp. 905_Psudmo1]